MGYYTDFTVAIHEDKGFSVTEEDLKTSLEINTPYKWDALSHNAKWYDYRSDMLTISKKYPNTTLSVLGRGENTGDIWVEYYRNGKFQRQTPEIVIPPLNEESWA